MSGVVSTLAVEWIEILEGWEKLKTYPVSTLAVEWIEMPKGYRLYTEIAGLHPRGGVD